MNLHFLLIEKLVWITAIWARLDAQPEYVMHSKSICYLFSLFSPVTLLQEADRSGYLVHPLWSISKTCQEFPHTRSEQPRLTNSEGNHPGCHILNDGWLIHLTEACFFQTSDKDFSSLHLPWKINIQKLFMKVYMQTEGTWTLYTEA